MKHLANDNFQASGFCKFSPLIRLCEKVTQNRIMIREQIRELTEPSVHTITDRTSTLDSDCFYNTYQLVPASQVTADTFSFSGWHSLLQKVPSAILIIEDTAAKSGNTLRAKHIIRAICMVHGSSK